MDVRVAGCGLALVVLVAGCVSQPAGPEGAGQPATTATGAGAELHHDGFEAGTAAVGGDVDQPEVSREGFEQGITATEIPVPTPTPTPPPGDAGHSSK